MSATVGNLPLAQPRPSIDWVSAVELIALALYGERIGARRSIALLVGFVGVFVLASGRTAGAGVVQATIAGTLAALCYGIAANMIRTHRTALPPVAVAAATLLSSTLL